ncbi:hypothetical protein [Spiroplasma turonicum]|uniref:Uncharacterized protein n=1 Tax=Spiroplasma turonicum TaxID=216946 RepID=A0A0K1P6E4_9MOLU|nr:hypothetical protein [Spiroplasma turonicum]AKU79873.1 hypothetical protein STURON_00627 [Spiroplasma turonicum]ALX70888.1 hypothetical protein STURO_v1c06270 [Spiroplasma turonicum]
MENIYIVINNDDFLVMENYIIKLDLKKEYDLINKKEFDLIPNNRILFSIKIKKNFFIKNNKEETLSKYKVLKIKKGYYESFLKTMYNSFEDSIINFNDFLIFINNFINNFIKILNNKESYLLSDEFMEYILISYEIFHRKKDKENKFILELIEKKFKEESVFSINDIEIIFSHMMSFLEKEKAISKSIINKKNKILLRKKDWVIIGTYLNTNMYINDKLKYCTKESNDSIKWSKQIIYKYNFNLDS